MCASKRYFIMIMPLCKCYLWRFHFFTILQILISITLHVWNYHNGQFNCYHRECVVHGLFHGSVYTYITNMNMNKNRRIQDTGYLCTHSKSSRPYPKANILLYFLLSTLARDFSFLLLHKHDNKDNYNWLLVVNVTACLDK